MARYVQRVSLVPFRAEEVWLGWELEGVEGDVDGLHRLDTLTADQRAQLDSLEYQSIPMEYLSDFTRSLG